MSEFFATQVTSEFGRSLTPEGAKGTLIFTGATASIRGNKTTSVFASGKHALRALTQSLAKEFGKENIHVAHAIIDGGILTDRSLAIKGEDWVKNPDVHLDPNSIAKVGSIIPNKAARSKYS